MRALRLLGLRRAELSILFTGPEGMRALNRRYRGVDGTTDVLSFPLYGSPREFPAGTDFLLGDIVINPSQAKLQALEHGLSLGQELRWLLVHGLLHLLGHEHEKGGYGKRKMREKELELLDALEGA